mgnify:CR=1 FL=1
MDDSSWGRGDDGFEDGGVHGVSLVRAIARLVWYQIVLFASWYLD